MRIALFVEVYVPYINGVVTHVKTLKDGLEKLGHKVLIVTADTKARRHYQFRGVLHCPAMELKRIYGYGLASPISRTRLKYLKNFNPDIIHIHTEFSIGLFGVMAAKSLNVPLVFTMHTMYDDYIYYVAPKPFYPAVKTASHSYAKFLTNQASAVTGPSAKVQQYLDQCGIDKDVHVIPNPVELDAFDATKFTDEDKSALRKKLGFSDDESLVCFVGRLGREKSVDVLLRYWAKTITPEDRVKLLVVGEGPAREELIELAESLGISHMVLFTGKVEHIELPPYYAICNMYVTASLSDTNSISMLEGMAAGLPVIHIYDELNQGQVTHGVNGFIYRNAEEMAMYIRKIRDMDPAEYEKLRKAVLDNIKKFSDIALAQRLLNVYSKVLEDTSEK